MTDDNEEVPQGFQWGWVVLSLLVFMIFYFLPLMLVPGGILSGGVVNEVSLYVLGIWGTAGVFIISAIMAYYSPGVTVWETVVSAIGVVLLMVVLVYLETNRLIVESTDTALGFTGVVLVVFAMAYMGGWWGERLQNIKDIIEDYPMDIEGVEETEDTEDEPGGDERT